MKKLYIFDEHANSLQNGIGTYIADLKRFLSDVVEVSVLSFNDTVADYRKEMCDGVTYYRFPVFCGGSFLGNYEIGLAVLRLEIADAPDNVFLFNYFLCNDLLRAMKVCYPLSKTIFVIHDQIWTERLLGDSRKLKQIMKKSETYKDGNYIMLRERVLKEMEMYRLADKVVTVSEDTLGLLKSVYGLSAEKVAFIPHGKEITCPHRNRGTKERLKKRLLLGYDDKIMLYVGRTTRCKGFHAVLSAFEKVAPIFPQTKLVVLGGVHDLGEAVALCPKSKVNVIFAGRVSKKELINWYRVADVGIVPSYSEQCGYAGMEMMAYGLPIVASDGHGVRRMFKGDYNAVVAKIGNIDKPKMFVRNLKRAMIEVLGMNAKQLDELRKNARRTYMEKYAMTEMKDAYVRLIGELTSEGVCNSVVQLPESVNRENVLKLILKCNDMYSLGLLKGRIGVALALMEFSRKYAVQPIRDFCFYTIRKCTEGIPSNLGLGFASGMAGIGWAMDYLKWRGLADVDTIEICREIDKRLMRYSLLRINDYTLDNGLEGLLMYVNLHLWNNIDRRVFDDCFLSELRAVLEDLPISAKENLRSQASLFVKIVDGKECDYSVSLHQFIKGFLDNDLSLQYGLAGKLLSIC